MKENIMSYYIVRLGSSIGEMDEIVDESYDSSEIRENYLEYIASRDSVGYVVINSKTTDRKFKALIKEWHDA